MSEDDDSLSLEMPDDLLIAIGRVAVEWSLFEFSVNHQIGELTNDEPAALCLTSQMTTIGRRFDAMIALARLCGFDEGIVRELNIFNEKTHGLSRKRNRVLHDVWLMDKDLSKRFEITAEKRLINEMKSVSVADVLKIAKEISDHDRQFMKIQEKIKVARESLPGTQRPASLPQDHQSRDH